MILSFWFLKTLLIFQLSVMLHEIINVISAKSKTLLKTFYKVPNQIFYSNQVIILYAINMCRMLD